MRNLALALSLSLGLVGAPVAAAPPPQAAERVVWPVVTKHPASMPALNGHTDSLADIVGRIDGPKGLVIFTEGNHFPVLLGGEVLDPFRAWAKADKRYEALDLANIVVVTLPQPVIVAMIRAGGITLGNATIGVTRESGFYPDLVMAGTEPLRALRKLGVVEHEARPFARNRGLALVVRKGNPARVHFIQDLKRPDIHVVLASAVEPGARALYRQALESLLGKTASDAVLARETVTFPGRLGIQHRDVLAALAGGEANVGIIYNHLAQYYARSFPDLVEVVPVLGAERFSSMIALTRVTDPLRAEAADAFVEYFLGIAAKLYPRYGFAVMPGNEYDHAIKLD